MDPLPIAEHVHRLYPDDYDTHGPPADVLDAGSGPLGAIRRGVKRQVLTEAWAYRGRGLEQAGWIRLLGSLAARVPTLRRRVGYRNVRMLPGPPGRLLDVGCGNGGFLATMTHLGWQAEGIEPDPRAAAEARRAGHAVREVTLDACALEPGRYDAITLHHSIEHLPDPAASLRQLAEALRPGGRLVSISPNPVSASARWFGRDWRALDVPRHLVLPGRRALLAGARAAGLAARVRRPSNGTRGLAHMSAPPGSSAEARWRDVMAVALKLAAVIWGGEELLLEARRA